METKNKYEKEFQASAELSRKQQWIFKGVIAIAIIACAAAFEFNINFGWFFAFLGAVPVVIGWYFFLRKDRTTKKPIVDMQGFQWIFIGVGGVFMIIGICMIIFGE